MAGFLVKETASHCIFVKRWRGSWRLHTIRKPRDPMSWSERFWLYEGPDSQAYMAALHAALLWDGSDDTEPHGWNRNGQTGRVRSNWEAGRC